MTQGPGAGWWLARDGRWYPPELHPSVLSGDQTVEQLTGVSAEAAAPAATVATETRTAPAVEPVTEAPTASAPPVEQPAVDQPVTDAPAASAPPVEQPAVDQPAAAPSAEPPVAEPPAIDTPTNVEVEAPTEPEPVAQEPTEAPERRGDVDDRRARAEEPSRREARAERAAAAAREAEALAEPDVVAPPIEATPEPAVPQYEPPAQDPAYDFEVASAPAEPAVAPQERRQASDAPRVNQVESDSGIRATVASTGSDEWDVPPEKPGRMLLAGIIAAAVILAGIAAYSFLSDGGDGHSIESDAQAEQQDDTVTSTAAGAETTPGIPLGVGVCINDIDLASREQVSDVVGVDCASDHTHEVYFQYDIDAITDFDLSSVRDEANSGCTAQFESYIGIDFAQSTYRVLAFHPFRDAWNAGDRTVTCLVFNPLQEVLTGSLQGTAS